MTTGIKRAMNLALGHFIAKRPGIPRPVQAAELTAIRSAIEDHFEEATAGVTAVDVEGGWTADESQEQHGLRVAMDMMFENLAPQMVEPPADPSLQVTHPPQIIDAYEDTSIARSERRHTSDMTSSCSSQFANSCQGAVN